jgi:Tol biopolymer transport system component
MAEAIGAATKPHFPLYSLEKGLLCITFFKCRTFLIKSVSVQTTAAFLFFAAFVAIVTTMAPAYSTVQSSNADFRIWSEEAEISQAWTTDILGTICPTTPSDTAEVITDPETDQIADPGSGVTISVFVMEPGSSAFSLLDETTEDSLRWCDVGGWRFWPETAGVHTFYAIARWTSDGEMVEMRSNEISVTVKPPIFGASSVDVLSENVTVERLLDWSPDGESILASYYEENEGGETRWEVLALMSPDGQTVEKFEMSETFDGIWDARFSPSGDAILMVARLSGKDNTKVFNYDPDGGLLAIAESRPDGHIDSAVWLDANRIAYGEEFGDYEEGTAGYAIWTANPDGMGTEELYEFTWTENESMELHDSKDGKTLLVTRTKAVQVPIREVTLFTFNVETKESSTILHLDDISIPRFSPAGDIVLYDIGPGYKTPGGPIEIVSIDGTLRETLDTGQKIPGDNPSSYVVSPDGRYVVAIATVDAQGALTRTELAHPMPEFGMLTMLLLSTIFGGIILSFRISRLRQFQ